MSSSVLHDTLRWTGRNCCNSASVALLIPGILPYVQTSVITLPHYKPAAADIPVASDNKRTMRMPFVIMLERLPCKVLLLPFNPSGLGMILWCGHLYRLRSSLLFRYSPDSPPCWFGSSQHPGELACFISPVAWTIIRFSLPNWRRRKIVRRSGVPPLPAWRPVLFHCWSRR